MIGKMMQGLLLFVLYPDNNRVDRADDSNLYFLLTSISIFNAYIPRIGHADY